MTFAELKTALGELMNDTDEKFFTTTEKGTWLNRANMQVNLHTRAIWDTATLSSTVTGLINLTTGVTDFMAPIHVHYNTNKLEYITREGLIQRNTRWTTQLGTPDTYYLRGHNLGLYPYTGTAGTNDVILHYLELPTTMSADGDYPLSGILRLQPLHELVLYRAAMMACVKSQDQKRLAMIKALHDESFNETSWLIDNPLDGEITTFFPDFNPY